MQATDNLHDTPEGASLLLTYYRQSGQGDRAAGTYGQLTNKYPKSVPIKMKSTRRFSPTRATTRRCSRSSMT